MYEQQMDMFQEGGVTLKDEGGEIEEVSGNEVPLGGVKEGVADDQPAQLSSGEMVLSEDVVRYHGVEKIMALRDEAKIGYHKMEAMGQLGNSDEATIPTEAIFNPGGMPFSVVDLEYIEMDENDDEAEVMAMADKEDEPIEAQTGTLVPVQQPAASFSRINPTTGLPEITTAPAASVPQVLQPGTPAPITTGSALTPTTLSTLTPTSTSISAPDRPVTQQPVPLAQLPKATQFLGGVSSTNFFINEIGQVIQIPVINGKQLFEEPEGFQPHDPTNPQPFDPDLEEDTGTDTEQPQQRRRTITEREEGGQPDAGPGGADTPTGAGVPGVDVGPSAEGLGLGSLEASSVAHENFAAGLISAEGLRDALDVKSVDVALGLHTQNRAGQKIAQLLQPLVVTLAQGLLGGDKDTSKSVPGEAELGGRKTGGRPSKAAPTRSPSSVKGGTTGSEDTPAAPDPSTGGQPTDAGGGTQEGGGTSTGGGTSADTGTESPAGGGLGSMSAGDVGSYMKKGGLVSELKPKKKAKNNRKGLASKKKY